jgi:hypothetical protein
MNWRGGIPFPTGNSRLLRGQACSVLFPVVAKRSSSRAFAEHCQFNSVAGLKWRKQPPLSRIQFAQGERVEATRSEVKESCMKLNSAQVERALTQFEAQALPDDHPVVPQLSSMFGDHTFFIDSGGLNVLEPTEASEPEAPVGMIVNLAYWSDETLTKLSPHEPEPTGVIVNLESRH